MGTQAKLPVLQLLWRGQSPRGNLTLLRMGSNNSKEKPQEGVLSQMKNLLKTKNADPVVAKTSPHLSTSRSSSLNSSPPSPRSLTDTWASPQLQAQFLNFLQDLDLNGGTPPTHLGRAGSLEFVLAVRQIKDERIEPKDWERFFPKGNKASGLVLNNDPQLWHKCSDVIRKEKLCEEDLQALHLARDHCLRQLAREHHQFLVHRATNKDTTMNNLALPQLHWQRSQRSATK